MKMEPALKHEEVSIFLREDFETGRLFWRSRHRDSLPSARAATYWESQIAGTEAFTAQDKDGYKKGAVKGNDYLAHRVIWLLHTGHWPADQIDHVNGIRSDNRICNLRPASNTENGRNKRIRSDNSSGVQGVGWCKREKKWQARIRVDGTLKHLGYFNDIQLAASVRKRAEREYGFHENHGRSL